MTGQSASPVLPEASRRSAGEVVKVMIVDDSITARTVLGRTVNAIEKIEVVASVSNAERALDYLDNARVDVILLDLEMPGMGGIAAIPLLVKKSRGARIIVVSHHTPDGAELAVEALSLGATDTFPKPTSGSFDREYRRELALRVAALGKDRTCTVKVAPPKVELAQRKRPVAGAPEVLAIGASTGGITALEALLKSLPPRIGVPIMISQHLPASFMDVFAKQVAKASGRPALVAVEGMRLRPDCILVAPGDAHLEVKAAGKDLVVKLTHERAATGCMPSLDPMFASLAKAYEGRVVAVVLSGMGRDGTGGSHQLVEAGGCIFVQDQATSAVWGMPRGVAEAGLASAVLPPQQIGPQVAKLLGMAA
ncbi:chemotaxis-specific protein-glutamate methyltransferase CheB [Aurantiacibacter sp. MUD11]|uniref:chemotaxis-specific protein-glutamate methyltransferase CheB n=1 Tax=Aurantiacibacter sp. MUD11 TaxID=3003265 RepID=UPI0022AA19CD|nr:chemotaxis-specific protein-glutamate methyltransferase CheB [Aurantiacibacter sp. MUD11]WAT17467.1 chemotaxis-specific protein-glutamate methyltransferase CheB [Aurantiacibacter sp. MUD11]